MRFRALVKIDCRAAQGIIAMAEERAAQSYELSILPSLAEEGITVIAGSAQSVMFALGDLAACGEDGLVFAGRV